jgi:hypothetical protein
VRDGIGFQRTRALKELDRMLERQMVGSEVRGLLTVDSILDRVWDDFIHERVTTEALDD